MILAPLVVEAWSRVSLANTRCNPDYSISQPDAINISITAANPGFVMMEL